MSSDYNRGLININNYQNILGIDFRSNSNFNGMDLVKVEFVTYETPGEGSRYPGYKGDTDIGLDKGYVHGPTNGSTLICATFTKGLATEKIFLPVVG